MTSRGSSIGPASVAVALALALGLAACGGEGGKADGKKPKVEATKTAGVTLTPSGTELELGEAATMTWEPNQNVKGQIAVTVKAIRPGTPEDVARFEPQGLPPEPRLYYVDIHLENVGKTGLGGVSPLNLPLRLDDGGTALTPPANLPEGMTFAPCPAMMLPAAFEPKAVVDTCLVYTAGSDVKRLLLQPKEGDLISWPGTVSTPAPSPSPTKKGAEQKPAATPAG